MILTVTSTAERASDLGYLLHKHPDRVQSFALPLGLAHVFYPEATDERCTVALLLEVDPIGLVRNKRFSGDGFALAQYVNDRPYAASSMLAVAIGRVFGSAMKGKCAARPDLEGQPLPLTIHLPSLPAPGNDPEADVVHRVFSPLGWTVEATRAPLDPEIPEWGGSRYADVTLTARMPLDQALTQLYVLLPVLDGSKHYWVSGDEVDKLIRNAGGWLQSHPERDWITRRYLAHRRAYITDATERLAALDDAVAPPDIDDAPDAADNGHVPLVEHRKAAVIAALTSIGAASIVDLGCGEGALIRDLLTNPSFLEIVGVDVSASALERAARLLERVSDNQLARVTLIQSSATYRDARIEGRDAVVLMEVIEHVDVERLPDLERSVFAAARPRAVVVTTPNAEYNARYPALASGGMRHRDHRFEWTRAEFGVWAERVAAEHDYTVSFEPVGEVDPDLGSPTQLALFTTIDRVTA